MFLCVFLCFAAAAVGCISHVQPELPPGRDLNLMILLNHVPLFFVFVNNLKMGLGDEKRHVN